MSNIEQVTTLCRKLFPEKHVTIGRSGSEINGLSAGTQPVGNILDSFVPKREQDRKFYLVEIENILVLLRVCKAMEGSDYDEFAVIHYTEIEYPRAVITEKFKSWKSAL